jgi:hypothetical protein
MKWLRSRLSYANVTATLALFLALGGGAYAAAKLPANSVGPEQLQSDAVSSPKVLDGSLLSKDFKAGELPAGGVSGLQVVYASSASGPGGTKDAEAVCPSGKKVTGGGSLVSGGSGATPQVSAPGQTTNPTSWYVEARQFTPNDVSWTVTAYAVCANTSG